MAKRVPDMSKVLSKTISVVADVQLINPAEK